MLCWEIELRMNFRIHVESIRTEFCFDDWNEYSSDGLNLQSSKYSLGGGTLSSTEYNETDSPERSSTLGQLQHQINQETQSNKQANKAQSSGAQEQSQRKCLDKKESTQS